MKDTYWVSHVDKADPTLADFFRKYEIDRHGVHGVHERSHGI